MGKVLMLIGWALVLVLAGCGDETDPVTPDPGPTTAVERVFGGAIDLQDLFDYAGLTPPSYIRKNNAATRPVTDAGATLGRVLFYDTELSRDRTVSCATCHRQGLAFSDDEQTSLGVAGRTGRHSMRLVNVRFAREGRMFWDERAEDLENQTTQPIQDHLEMGFSGRQGDPALDSLLTRLMGLDYYNELFAFVFGDTVVTEERLQDALSQFVRSIHSFDSRFDEGRVAAGDDRRPFANFTAQENRGKDLFILPPNLDAGNGRIGGGLGCAGCHQPPEFDLDPAARNNGVIRTAGGVGTDLTVTHAPTLRDVVQADGTPNGPHMHTGDFTLDDVLDHYNRIDATGNPDLDVRLRPQGVVMDLRLTTEEREAVEAFLRTLAGQALYTDPRWSDPFRDHRRLRPALESEGRVRPGHGRNALPD